MKKQKIFFIISLSTLLIMLGANVYASCDNVRCYGQLERLYINSDTLYISTDGDENNLSCSAPGGIYITLPTSSPDFNRFYAMMLTSLTMQKEIGLRIQSGSEDCRLVYTYIDN